MSSSSLQHNSPSRGWVPCKAKKRACRYGGDLHRTVQLSSNLEKHSSEIYKSAANGVIDAQETKDLSKSIADDILSPKIIKEAVEPELMPAGVAEDIQPVEAEVYETQEWNSDNRELYEARFELNEAAKRLNEASKKNSDYTNNLIQLKSELEEEVQNFSPENFEAMYADGADGAYGDDPRPKAEIKAEIMAHGDKLRADISGIDQKLNKKNRFFVDSAKDNYSRKKANYDMRNDFVKKNEGKTVRLAGISKDYFNTTHSIGPKLSVDSYNQLIGELTYNHPEISEKEKIESVKQLREELIVIAKSNYRSNRPGSVTEKIGNFFNKIKGYGYTPEQEKIKFKEDMESHNRQGLALGSFAKRFRESSWDSIIK